ncbi:hypothetical protein EUGRSUZ_L00103 [Eucalyptus grandis]|uniref:Uncharacterized protein n=2 Tax=Eucalyptus grandis TaxID=71139 RepID=A0ACC3L4N5_EUCGR|nr:hypothetical protein EUGRSUZ_L00103 [Eucalyptus grandis]
MDTRLQQAIDHDDVDELYRLIEQDQDLLDQGSRGPFPNTPLHYAVDEGKTKVAMEIAILNSPMHLALQKKHYDIVRALITLNPELIRVRGRGWITPLHFVSREMGENEQENVELLDLLAEFLSAYKSSVEDLTSQCETAVHIAVKNYNIKAFKVLFGWLKRAYMTEILDWKDQDGNNVLHIAASQNQPEIIKLLIGYTKINAKNFQDETALEIFQANPIGNQDVVKMLCRRRCLARLFTPTLSLSQFFSTELTFFETHASFFGIQDKSTHKIILLVSTLIATATY